MYNVTITAGMTSSSFDVDITDNMIPEGDKMFTITIRLISTCLPVTIDSDTTTVTIIDDEGKVVIFIIVHPLHYCCSFVDLVLRVQFGSTTFNASESSGEILVTINISGRTPNVDISVDLNFSEVTATG